MNNVPKMLGYTGSEKEWEDFRGNRKSNSTQENIRIEAYIT